MKNKISLLKIAMVDDDTDLSERLLALINRQEDMHCLFSASGLDDFFQKMNDQAIPDVLLLDLYLDGENSTQAIEKIKRLLPGVKIIIVTGHGDSESVRNTFQYQIDGYYIKGDASANLPDIIRNTVSGGAYITPRAARIILDSITNSDKVQSATLQQIRSKLPWSAPYRTLQVIEGLLSGKTYQEIASGLGLSVDGVRYYTRQIYKHLNINKRAQLNKFFEEPGPK